ncbi:MAG TPA: DUF3566 domain-containing protein [Acidimicrobiia bacterium]|jgi:hypothetical protein|nr:DUF3566 domain-containing protein [Acidimicrobiia bacterium]
MATVRRVRRIIRKIDPWTVLKVSAILNAVAGVAIVLGVVIFWSVVDNAGIPDALTDFLVRITLIEEGTDPFANSEQFFRFVVFGSIVWWAVSTGFMTLMSVMYNLVTDVVGGLEVVVLEEHLGTSNGPVLHPPAGYTQTNGGRVTPPPEHADIPTEEAPVVPIT